MIAVTDTGPLNYLILSGHVYLLRELYTRILIPSAVCRELQHAKAPKEVCAWVSAPPAWVSVVSPKRLAPFPKLGPGEREAIALAIEARADFVLMDETEGRRAALSNGIRVKGTLGILEEAADKGMIRLPAAVRALRQTGIFLREELVNEVLLRHRQKRA